MFSRSKAPEVAPLPQAAAPKKQARSASAPSIISADLTVTGTLISAGDVQVDGRVEGDLRVSSLVIGERAVIQGDIYAEEAVIRRRVNGSIRARKVQLCATAHVEGNILHEALAVEAGAYFEGNCRHADNPLGDEILRRPAIAASAVPNGSERPIVAKPMTTSMPTSMSTPIKPGTPLLTDPSLAPRAAANFTPLKG